MTDILITGGRIIDGTGNAWFYGDLAIAGDRIERIAPPGTIDPATATTHIDASGHVVSPGFIDIQSHSIVPFINDRRAVSKVTQGVTTEIMGELWTPAPFGGKIASPFDGAHSRDFPNKDEWDARARTWTRFGDWLADLESRQVSVNVGSFLGGATVREFGMGNAMGDATPDAIQAMRQMVDEAMEDGAFGVATALIYPPNAYSDTEELVAVMEVVAKHKGIHITHMRSEGDKIDEGFAETLEIAERTGVVTEIYHLKASGEKNWPKMREIINGIDAARARGIDIAADMYPYNGSGTGLTTVLPNWTMADGKLLENLRDPETRARMLKEMRENPKDPDVIILATLTKPEHKKYQGQRLSAVAKDLGMDWAEAAVHLLDKEENRIPTFFLRMSEENLELQAKQPWIKFSTDAGGIDPETAASKGLTHPRAYGTYTRVIGRYVREFGWLTLEDAVRKSSSSVADRLGLRDRGLLRDGMFADVIVFDPDTVIDNATYDDPHRLSTGIRDVFVNGTAVLRDGTHTGALPGKRVNGPAYKG